jgi:hypothetical protein
VKKSKRIGISVFLCLISLPGLQAGDRPDAASRSAQNPGSAPVAPTPQTGRSVNTAAAIRSLKRATDLLADSSWDDAAFEAKLGATYDPGIADFAYIEALALASKGAARADVLERVAYSLSEGLFWRTYSKNEALVLCARLRAETRDYRGSLSALSLLREYSGADSDYVRVLDYYALGRLADARDLVSSSLERWPFDPRFPRAFLTREATRNPDARAADLAARILSRLYVWENDDRELLLLAVPFETDAARRERDIRTYRNMGKSDGNGGAPFSPLPSSALAALEYGIIDDVAAAREILSASATGIDLAILRTLSTLVASDESRSALASALDSFDGIITEDASLDGIVDARVRYRLGRPLIAEFDPDQDGYPDYTIECDLGSPKAITDRSRSRILYTTYPDVLSVASLAEGDRERTYTMRPLSLKFAPVEWVRERFAFGGSDFFTVRLVAQPPILTERLLVSSAAQYVERPSPSAAGNAGAASGAENPAETRVTLDAGVPVSAETRDSRGKVTGWTAYARGYPSSASLDRDGDGYFETSMKYGPAGFLSSVTVDRNGNRTPEYREDYSTDGTVTLRWDSDENGAYEISSVTTKDGRTELRWLHPVSGAEVSVTVDDGQPRTVRSAAGTVAVVKDPFAEVWWIGRVPSDSRRLTEKIAESFNLGDDSVVTLTFYDSNRRVSVVRTGGFLFAELLDE